MRRPTHGELLVLAATFLVGAVSAFGMKQPYAPWGLGFCSIVAFGFWLFTRASATLRGVIVEHYLTPMVVIPDSPPEHASLSSFGAVSLTMFGRVANATNILVSITACTLQFVDSSGRSHWTKLRKILQLPTPTNRKNFSNSPVRYLTTVPPADFKSLDELLKSPVTAAGVEGWIEFAVEEIDEKRCANGRATLVLLDSLGKKHTIEYTLPPAQGEQKYEEIVADD